MENFKLDGFQTLLNSEDVWESAFGGIVPGKRAVFRGLDMFAEFKDYTWIEMLYFCLSGKKPTEGATKFINGVFCMCFNYPDPRIWCNRVAALAGTVSSTAQLGVCAASAVTEAEIYGGPTGIKAMDFLFRLKKAKDGGLSISEVVKTEIKTNKGIFGYGRPINPIDERVKPALQLLEELNLHDREYINLALEVEQFLIKNKYKIYLNIAGVFAAFCADQGLKREDMYYLGIVCFSIGMLACYLETTEKSEGTLFPLRCDRISYEGVEMRKW